MTTTATAAVPDTYGLGALRAKFGAHDISIGRDSEGYKVYIDDRYEAVKPTYTKLLNICPLPSLSVCEANI